MVDLARVPVYLATDSAILLSNLGLVALMTVGVLTGTIVGAPILRPLPERRFRELLALLLIGLGLLLVIGTVS